MSWSQQASARYDQECQWRARQYQPTDLLIWLALDVQGTLGQVNNTLDNAQAFTEKLNSNKGTLGSSMNDTQLYDNHERYHVAMPTRLVIDLKAAS